MITSNANRDLFHALNPNSNLNANPTYICYNEINENHSLLILLSLYALISNVSL